MSIDCIRRGLQYSYHFLLKGAEELNRSVKSMKDTNSLLPQLRTFLTFLDSSLEAETNFKVTNSYISQIFRN